MLSPVVAEQEGATLDAKLPPDPMDIIIQVAGPEHFSYAEAICVLIEEAARARGTGIAKRKPEYIQQKIEQGKAIIALHGDEVAGFCYIETWSHGKYVANSGLIVAPAYRKMGLAKRIKRRAFQLSREKYPDAKLFGITTSLAVMKINSELGYKPVTFSELTTDDVFWQGCQSCPNFDVLTRMERKMCLCTGMLYDPEQEERKGTGASDE
jgi:GNAT superfamily N-acetyltransferase